MEGERRISNVRSLLLSDLSRPHLLFSYLHAWRSLRFLNDLVSSPLAVLCRLSMIFLYFIFFCLDSYVSRPCAPLPSLPHFIVLGCLCGRFNASSPPQLLRVGSLFEFFLSFRLFMQADDSLSPPCLFLLPSLFEFFLCSLYLPPAPQLSMQADDSLSHHVFSFSASYARCLCAVFLYFISSSQQSFYTSFPLVGLSMQPHGALSHFIFLDFLRSLTALFLISSS